VTVSGDLVARLRAAGCVFAEDEAAVLMGATEDPAELERLVQRRIGGEPLEYVVGWAEFCGVRIAVAEGVFVPRRRSEFLAHCARSYARQGVTVLDMCCGTGALGLIVTQDLASFSLHAVDNDEAAIACASGNLPEAAVYLGDLFAPLPTTLRGSVDIVVAVTPYVPSGALEYLHREARLYEPATTHDGGPDGLALTGRIFAEVGAWLAPGGVVLLEVSVAQAPLAIALAQRHGLRAHAEFDEASDATVVTALV